VQLVVSGGYDLSSDQIDLRAVLSPSSATMNVGGVHPEIQVLAGGTPDKLSRTSDLSALSSWLTLRAVDRETKRLEAIERNTQANRATDPAPAPQTMAPGPQPNVPNSTAPPATTAPEMPAPQASSAPVQQKSAVPPLPPPVEIKPAPAPQPRPQQPKARPPLALTPQ
jgi:hypothetical protein